MTLPLSLFDIPESERTPLVNWLLQVIEQQQGTIAKLEEKVTQLEARVGSLDEQSHCCQEIEGEAANPTKHALTKR